MNTLNKNFDDLLSNIEPSDETIDFAREAHIPLRDHLKDDDEFKEFYVDSYLYGSYARETATGDIKDIDIVIITKFDRNNEEHTPKKVLSKLRKAIEKYYEGIENNTEYQRKSILVKVALPDKPECKMTLDVIPGIEEDGKEQPILVPDREDGDWVYTHPRGHMNFTTLMNDKDHGDKMFVPTVKMMRHWWKSYSGKVKPKPKGFWVETLVGYHFDQDKSTYAEHFIAVLESISKKYKNYEDYNAVPEIEDPGMKGEIVKTSMSIEDFKSFMEKVNDALEKAQKAVEEDDDHKASKAWNKLFGEEFPISEESTEESNKSTSARVSYSGSGLWANNE